MCVLRTSYLSRASYFTSGLLSSSSLLPESFFRPETLRRACAQCCWPAPLSPARPRGTKQLHRRGTGHRRISTVTASATSQAPLFLLPLSPFLPPFLASSLTAATASPYAPPLPGNPTAFPCPRALSRPPIRPCPVRAHEAGIRPPALTHCSPSSLDRPALDSTPFQTRVGTVITRVIAAASLARYIPDLLSHVPYLPVRNYAGRSLCPLLMSVPAGRQRSFYVQMSS
ncbi:hypothetical protein BV20DRAFT_504651 [Pilatotrama ljubarskyi]|nr:hypothetical protein BV20DRAFT_504651 [Pilatotrama ljubarskyi]